MDFTRATMDLAYAEQRHNTLGHFIHAYGTYSTDRFDSVASQMNNRLTVLGNQFDYDHSRMAEAHQQDFADLKARLDELRRRVDRL